MLAAMMLAPVGSSQGNATVSTAAAPVTESGHGGLIGDLGLHYVRPGETFIDIIMGYGLGYVELRAANPNVDPWLPGDDAMLVLPTQHIVPKDAGPGILVNLGDLRIYYFPPEGGEIQSWPISTGREAYETPLGIETVTEKTENPTWVPTKNHRAEDPTVPAYVKPGPDNPLGSHRIRVGWDGYAIHGTNKPEGIGRRVSRGCVRLYPAHIQELFDIVKVGTPVAITNQPVKLGWLDGELYIEVHPFGDEIDQIEFSEPVERQDIEGLDEMVFEAAGRHVRRVNWNAVYAAATERRGIPVQITR